MPVERSAGAVIYRATKKGKEYLLLHHRQNEKTKRRDVDGHWDFPKGHLEKKEKTEDTARREIKEETGITNLIFIPGFKETIHYFVRHETEKRLKFVAFFLVKTNKGKVRISWEHQGYAWLPFKEAYELLTYKNAKDVLKKAHNFLSKKGL